MEISEYREHLCEANQKLLAEIEHSITVKFEKSVEDCWMSSIRKKDNCGVVYCLDYFSDSKIAHELLHIKVGLVMGDNEIMLIKCGQNAILNRMFFNNNYDAASQVLNAYEHLVIYPMYIEMGFDKNDFFEAENTHDYDKFLAKLKKTGIRTNGLISYYDFVAVFSCIFSYLFFPIDERFKEQLAVIKKNERELFSIFKSFKNQLIKIPINKKGRIEIQNVYSTFMSSLDKFILKNCDMINI